MDLLRVKLAGLLRPSLRARVDETEAIRFFTGRGLSGFISPLWRGSLRSVALVQVPYRIFAVESKTGAVPMLAFDLFTGTLDPYTLDSTTEFEPSSASERNHLPARLDDQQALMAAQERYQRLRFQEGFFKHAGEATTFGEPIADVFVPYWVGFFGNEPRLSLRTLNAVRRVEEGSRLRHAITTWMIEPPRSD